MTSPMRRILRAVASGKVSNADVELAAALLKPRKRIKQKLSEPSRKDARVAKRASRAQRVRAILEAVRTRAALRCELGAGMPHAGVHLHHLEAGGKRRALEDVSNAMWVCEVCHGAYHRRPETFRDRVLAWAEHYGYPIPSRFRAAAEEVRT